MGSVRKKCGAKLKLSKAAKSIAAAMVIEDVSGRELYKRILEMWKMVKREDDEARR